MKPSDYSTHCVKQKLISLGKFTGLISVLLLTIDSTISATLAAPTTPANLRRVEQALQNLYKRQLGVPIELVNCPSNANLRAGGTFDCQTRAQGVNFKIRVNMADSRGKFNSHTRGLLILSKIEALIQKSVKEKTGVNVTANCGGKLRTARPGEAFFCQVKSLQGQTRKAQVTVKDELGNTTVKL